MEIDRGMLFSSRSMMGRDEIGKIHQVLLSLNTTFDSAPFREPVNWQEFGLLDYPTIIKSPMDLSTVRKKLDTNRYEYVEDCLDDINLIWANAKAYNPKENVHVPIVQDIHKLADKLEKQTKKMIRNYLPFVKVDTQAGRKKTQKKESKAPAKPLQKTQEPRTYLEKQQEAKTDNANAQDPEAEEPQHAVLRKNLLFLMQLCNKDQVGVIFQLLLKHNPEVLSYEEDGSVNVHGDRLDDKITMRLNKLVELWGYSMRNTYITNSVQPTKKK